MNLENFDREIRHQKTMRILVYPNITFQKDLEKDSYIQVIKKQIELLNELRDDLWFYMILPEHIPSLDFENVTQWYLDMPTYPPTMRSHFDVFQIQKLLNRRYDFDLVMCHLPEHAHALKNVLYNVTHHVPPFIGYCHWFDVEEVVAWPKDSFLQNITGLLEYERCYLNTEYQKQLVLKQARETFNEETVRKLDKILVPQRLGVDEKDIVDKIEPNAIKLYPYEEKLLVFNHRPDTYKHFKEFVKVIDDLWELRRDFRVWIPLLDKPTRDWMDTSSGDKQWYYKKLRTCYLGFSPKQTYGGWSVSTTDGMMNGCPYIMYDAPYYHELNPQGEFFDSDYEALMFLNNILSDNKFRNEMAEQALSHIRTNLIYKNNIIGMNMVMNRIVSEIRTIGDDSEKLNEIIMWIQSNKSMTKEQIIDKLGWGRGIKWTPYRRALMNHPNIMDTNDEIPTYQWVE